MLMNLIKNMSIWIPVGKVYDLKQQRINVLNHQKKPNQTGTQCQDLKEDVMPGDILKYHISKKPFIKVLEKW